MLFNISIYKRFRLILESLTCSYSVFMMYKFLLFVVIYLIHSLLGQVPQLFEPIFQVLFMFILADLHLCIYGYQVIFCH